MPNPKRGCRTGKVGERAAAKLLRELGFYDARRTQQHTGDAGDSDVVCPETLPNLFIEVKNDARYHVSATVLRAALTKAQEQAAKVGQFPVVLWNERRYGWRMTWTQVLGQYGVDCTVSGGAIGCVLRVLQSHAQERA